MSSNRLKGRYHLVSCCFHPHRWHRHWQLHHFQTVGSSDVDLMQMILFLKMKYSCISGNSLMTPPRCQPSMTAARRCVYSQVPSLGRQMTTCCFLTENHQQSEIWWNKIKMCAGERKHQHPHLAGEKSNMGLIWSSAVYFDWSTAGPTATAGGSSNTSPSRSTLASVHTR